MQPGQFSSPRVCPVDNPGRKCCSFVNGTLVCSNQFFDEPNQFAFQLGVLYWVIVSVAGFVLALWIPIRAIGTPTFDPTKKDPNTGKPFPRADLPWRLRYGMRLFVHMSHSWSIILYCSCCHSVKNHEHERAFSSSLLTKNRCCLRLFSSDRCGNVYFVILFWVLPTALAVVTVTFFFISVSKELGIAGVVVMGFADLLLILSVVLKYRGLPGAADIVTYGSFLMFWFLWIATSMVVLLILVGAVLNKEVFVIVSGVVFYVAGINKVFQGILTPYWMLKALVIQSTRKHQAPEVYLVVFEKLYEPLGFTIARAVVLTVLHAFILGFLLFVVIASPLTSGFSAVDTVIDSIIVWFGMRLFGHFYFLSGSPSKLEEAVWKSRIGNINSVVFFVIAI
jgi:hypothetical protein